LSELRNADGPGGIRAGHKEQRLPANLLLAASWNPERARDQAKGTVRDASACGFAICYGQPPTASRGETPNTCAARTLGSRMAELWGFRSRPRVYES